MRNLFQRQPGNLNKMIQMSLAKAQIGVNAYNRDMAILLKDRETIEKNVKEIEIACEKVRIIHTVTEKFKQSHPTILQTKDTVNSVVELKDRVLEALKDIESEENIKTLVEVGSMCKESHQEVEKILAEERAKRKAAKSTKRK